ncbi:putative ATP-dependent RNA helicase DHX57 isoform X1 [Diabrotica virgifera virgifera]|uniref:RNA helicase n=1 Tax=Diabrotica virgifera virgifera TaxID=50390 RepID=A0A6P7FWH4_DIAVI|nr:putative ATP-dependent RNA helicase DHX57 isoform X1 [Diabrotica virgifera virgifera]
MNGEDCIDKTDFFLREIPDVKIGQTAPLKKKIVKEELQYLTLPELIQEKILDTLKYIHGPNFKLSDISDYEESNSNLLKRYWVGQGSLVVKGGVDFSQSRDQPEEEAERLKQFGLMRLESYGFHKNHCLEAFEYCKGDVEDSIYLLYQKYFNFDAAPKEIEHGLSKKELTEQRDDEKSSLESIYEKSFNVKTDDVWILNLKLEYLVDIFHNKEIVKKKPVVKDKREKCRNLLRGNCKFGAKCRFSHEIEPKEEKKVNSHLEDFTFELEFRFPSITQYPYEPPLIFLKTNAILPPLVNLHLCKRLYEEAKLLAEDGIPCVYTITELLQNEEEIKQHLKEEVNFLHPNQKLFAEKKYIEKREIKPSHYQKGSNNRSNKKFLSLEQLQKDDKRVVESFYTRIKDEKYKKMLNVRKNLPAWSLQKDILNSINQSPVIVVSGETGCGKSTQVPQFILDEWIKNYGNDNRHVEIVCTQPRRISAIGVAERVADERVDKIGNTVGYQIRLESKMSSSTRLSFCTTGILLRRLEGEPTLPNVTHIIVDEVHERSEESDFLLLILKELLQIRPDLKVILMSATVNASLFSQYFGDIPVIDIPGRTFPVEQYFLEDILETTGYVMEDGSEYCRKLKKDEDYLEIMMSANEVGYSNQKPRDNVKDESLNAIQVMARYQDYSITTCKNIFIMDPDKINYDLIEHVLEWIVAGDHDYPKVGTILVFLPGIGEITTLYDQLNVHPELGKRRGKYLILPLHSSLSSEEQSAIFRKPNPGQRKIVLSTNLAETSITIDDCVFVIDSGKMKEKRFDPNRNMESLETTWVTRANALQRKGRAGRVMSGVCIHLYTSHRFRHNILPQPIPEINRIPLEQLILNIKVLQNFENRDVVQVLGSFIEPPTLENIVTAVKRLENVGALDKHENLTPLGHHLATLPVDVRIGKLILYGAIFGCVDAALTMAACLSSKSPFVSPFGKREEANKKKKSFAVGMSDHVTTLMAYKKFLQIYKKSSVAARHFAVENFLSYRTLTTIADIKKQFLELLVDIGFVPVNLSTRRRLGWDDVYEITGPEFNRNGENIRLLSSILCAALYPNVVKILTPSKSYIMSSAGAVPKENEAKDLKFTTVQETVFMHPSSINYTVRNFPSPYLVYQEKIQTSKVFFRECTMVPVLPLILFSSYDLNINVQGGNTFIVLEDGWIVFQVDEHKIAEMIKFIRMELFNLLEEKIRDPLLNLLHHDRGEKIIATILGMINSH